ncbi:DHHW family protein [Paenibacillus sp. NPDC058174]|uniref:DHHW family protein n=1 Tax=Paenibacillus sp. NPDC058174 TaxID=3346366 RepID=UPI0036D780C0
MNKRTDRIYAAGFAILLFAFSLLFLFMPKKAFSEIENRSLQKTPQFSWNKLLDKTFSEQTESFVTDHFPLRDQWVAVKSTMEQLRLQQENNGIYKGKDGFLFEQFAEPEPMNLAKFTEAVNKFANKNPHTNISFLLAPTSIGIYPERLPWLAPAYPQSIVNNSIKEQVREHVRFINGFDFLKPAAETDPNRDLYYRTDHHWTTYGAYLAYRAYAEQMGWQPMEESEFDIRTVTNSFLGSYHTRSQFNGLKPDSIQAYLPKNKAELKMHIFDDDTTVQGLYEDSFLAKKDKYSYFLGGVHALMTIKTELPPDDADLDKLLVIKDSYAHSMLPFLALHVPEIHIIDLRYYNGNITSYMKENEFNGVLLLFNTTTFSSGQVILKLGY